MYSANGMPDELVTQTKPHTYRDLIDAKFNPETQYIIHYLGHFEYFLNTTG